ncbi:hypothetical protein HMPREF2811_10760 [Globicatella sp. HMSC072A10]|uniref:DUF6339 family protein n=1 Tax=Globicatella sp. HMSC072A10 TaxID=1739315 RepID=UPI0008AC19DF|nr:DUF6339 family protein [Globicatella sp. HMSC072A10]OFK62029.1 hypothetical protein HMPREF2811_10760 [Globicatella sp. HMSC072A10]
MKLYYMRQEILEDLKNNIAHNIENYSNESNQWIMNQYENPFLEYKKTVDDFELLVDPKDVGSSDMENVRILHSNLKFLTKSEAADERLWTGLTHSVFWNFMKERWSSRPSKEEKQIGNRYFLTGGSSNRRALLMNTISRYWWIGELIYDEDNIKNPYYLIEVFRGDFTTNVHTLLSSNFTSNTNILKGVLRPMLEYKEVNGSLSREEFQAIIRYANLIGGSYLLDYLSTEEIEEKICLYIDNTISQNLEDKETRVNQAEDKQEQVRKKGIFGKLKESLLGGA